MTVRFNLPEIAFAEKSATQIETDVLANYKKLTGQTLAEADPRRIFIQTLLPILVQQRVLIDHTGKQNLLSYSVGDPLDHIGSLTETPRLGASYATTTERFTLTSTLAQAYTIPSGFQLTAGDNVFWATTIPLTIPAGQLTSDVEIECQSIGTVGNGYLPGMISLMVAPLADIASVSNLTKSEGGAETEADDSYADRIHEAPESFSTAGPDGAYIYWAKTASQTIADVKPYSPSPGVVKLVILLSEGEIPGQKMLDDVSDAFQNRKIRPLTDNVQTAAPEQVSYDIDLEYWINADDSKIVENIQSKVNQAIVDYKLWQKSKLGRDIDPSELTTRIKNAGAKRVAVNKPLYQKLEIYQVAKEGTENVVYGGLEDE